MAAFQLSNLHRIPATTHPYVRKCLAQRRFFLNLTLQYYLQIQVTMQSSISEIPGLGEVTLEAFHRAGYRTVQDLYTFDVGCVAGDRRLMWAINDMKNSTNPPLPDRYYRALGTRCANIVNRVKACHSLTIWKKKSKRFSAEKKVQNISSSDFFRAGNFSPMGCQQKFQPAVAL